MASYARLIRQKYPYRAPSASVDHLVVGGGVVGLAVAAGLVNTAGSGRTTFLVERRQLVSLRFCAQHLSVSLAHKPSRWYTKADKQLGQENTARNSEVIHSGKLGHPYRN